MELETPQPTSQDPGTPRLASRTMQRKDFLKATATGAAVVAAGGVGAQAVQAARKIEAPYVKTSPSGEILVWVNANPFSPAQVAAFNKVYPNIKVKQQATAYVPATASLSAHLVTGVGVPDGIFFIEDQYYGTYAANLFDLTKWVEPYASKIAPYKLAVAKQGGKIVAVPWDLDPAFLIYRIDIVEKAGVDVSKIKTYDDLIKAAQTVKEKVPTCKTPLYFLDGDGFRVFFVEGMVWQQHGNITDSSGKLAIMDQKHTNAFNYLEKAYKAGVVGMGQFTTPALYNDWNSGKTCFMHFADWFTHWNEQGMKGSWGKIGLAPQPVFNPGKDSPFSNMGGSGYVVPLKAKNPELSALFGVFQLFDPRALQAGNGAVIYEATLPSAEALWPDVNLNDLRHKMIINKNIDEHALLVEGAKQIPGSYHYTPWYSQMMTYYGPPVRQVLTGKMSAAAAQQKAYNDVLTKVVQRWKG
ncbi:MAG TPA: extracellular solute-binding protein [Chloroflexota bacterium]|nr:extracellular solute-binding protein [Chloroflexota bacterium]